MFLGRGRCGWPGKTHTRLAGWAASRPFRAVQSLVRRHDADVLVFPMMPRFLYFQGVRGEDPLKRGSSHGVHSNSAMPRRALVAGSHGNRVHFLDRGGSAPASPAVCPTRNGPDHLKQPGRDAAQKCTLEARSSRDNLSYGKPNLSLASQKSEGETIIMRRRLSPLGRGHPKTLSELSPIPSVPPSLSFCLDD